MSGKQLVTSRTRAIQYIHLITDVYTNLNYNNYRLYYTLNRFEALTTESKLYKQMKNRTPSALLIRILNLVQNIRCL